MYNSVYIGASTAADDHTDAYDAECIDMSTIAYHAADRDALYRCLFYCT
jgi:hypothetical protein